MTGMQAARLKAESQGRKAKVGIDGVSSRRKGNGFLGNEYEGLIHSSHSLPIHIMSYWSTYLLEQAKGNSANNGSCAESSRRKNSAQ